MGLGKLIARPPSAPPAETRTITEFAIIDGVRVDGSGQWANRYRGAMAVPGAWRASLLLSDLLGSVPWDAYRQIAGRPEEKMVPTPLLLEQPAPPDTRMTTFSSMALDLIYHGNAVGIIAAWGAGGWPTAFVPVPAEQVGVRRVEPGMNSPLPVGEVEYQVGGRSYGADRVLHVKGPCEPGALRGMGVLEAHSAGTIALAQEQIRQAQSISQHGVPTGVLQATSDAVDEDELKATKAVWLKSQRDRTVAALSAAVNFQPLSWNPHDMQLVEARRYTLTDLELIFGLPVGWLGGMNSARQYSNIEQDAVNLLKFSLGGHLARFEQTFTLWFPRGTQARADLDAFLRPDTLARYQAYATGLDKKFLTVDEVRAAEHRPPLPKPEPAPPAPPVTEEEDDDDGEAEDDEDGA